MTAMLQRVMGPRLFYLFEFRRFQHVPCCVPQAAKSAQPLHRSRRNTVSTKPATEWRGKGSTKDQFVGGFEILPAPRSDVAAMIRTATTLPAALTRIGIV